MTTLPTLETFEKLINTKFQITFDSQNAYEVELVEIKKGTPINELNIQPFSLLFRGDTSEKLFAQCMYTVYSEDIGSIDLFLIPKQLKQEGIHYEAVFS